MLTVAGLVRCKRSCCREMRVLRSRHARCSRRSASTLALIAWHSAVICSSASAPDLRGAEGVTGKIRLLVAIIDWDTVRSNTAGDDIDRAILLSLEDVDGRRT